MFDLNMNNEKIVEDYRVRVLEKTQTSYMLTIARDGEHPARSIYFYDSAIDAASGYDAYTDWGFAKEYLTVVLYEPTGKVVEKTLKRPKGGECTFVRDDYTKAAAIIEALKNTIDRKNYNYIVYEFAKLFSKDNQRFDEIRFLTDLDYTGDTNDKH